MYLLLYQEHKGWDENSSAVQAFSLRSFPIRPLLIEFVSHIETIDNPPDMKEANNRMPRLFDFGMQCGHPLLVQQYKLTYVSRV